MAGRRSGSIRVSPGVALPWAALAFVVVVPLVVAASSPLLAWRDPVYVVAGVAGVLAMALLLLQPLLAGGYLPGLRGTRGRRVHRRFGGALLAAVAVHVGGLWLTSPPDVVDALLLRSPTPFSVWGVVALWAVVAAAAVATFRRGPRLQIRHRRVVHTTLATIVVTASAVHAMLVEGTMGTVSKAMLCAAALAATAWVVVERRRRARVPRRREGPRGRRA